MAIDRTQPYGRVLGIDIIPAQPPKGVSTIQGNFLAPEVQAYVQEFLRDPKRGRPRSSNSLTDFSCDSMMSEYCMDTPQAYGYNGSDGNGSLELPAQNNTESQRTVDVVLSDMSAPWHQTSGFWKRSLSNPYNRMMNTSGMSFRDHAGSMVRDLPPSGCMLSGFLTNRSLGLMPCCTAV